MNNSYFTITIRLVKYLAIGLLLGILALILLYSLSGLDITEHFSFLIDYFADWTGATFIVYPIIAFSFFILKLVFPMKKTKIYLWHLLGLLFVPMYVTIIAVLGAIIGFGLIKNPVVGFGYAWVLPATISFIVIMFFNYSEIIPDDYKGIIRSTKDKAKSIISESNIDSSYYAVAEDEIVNGNIDRGLWSKALVNAKGNETVRKAEYIKLRAKELQRIENDESKQIKDNSEKDIQQQKKLKLSDNLALVPEELRYREMAKQGDAWAQYNLGLIYQEGCGVSKDDAQAVYWYQKAAEQGLIAAQNKLGYMYEEGRGVSKDYTQAVYWYQKAAEQGDAWAKTKLQRTGEMV